MADVLSGTYFAKNAGGERIVAPFTVETTVQLTDAGAQDEDAVTYVLSRAIRLFIVALAVAAKLIVWGTGSAMVIVADTRELSRTPEVLDVAYAWNFVPPFALSVVLGQGAEATVGVEPSVVQWTVVPDAPVTVTVCALAYVPVAGLIVGAAAYVGGGGGGGAGVEDALELLQPRKTLASSENANIKHSRIVK